MVVHSLHQFIKKVIIVDHLFCLAALLALSNWVSTDVSRFIAVPE